MVNAMETRVDLPWSASDGGRKLPPESQCFRLPLDPVPDGCDRRTLPCNEGEPLNEVRTWVERDRYMLDILGFDPADLEAVTDGIPRKARPVLDAGESL